MPINNNVELRPKRDSSWSAADRRGWSVIVTSQISEVLADKLRAAYRALQNPGLFKYEHYRQAALAVCAGIVIRLLIGAPVSFS